jgi:hypothetical protein
MKRIFRDALHVAKGGLFWALGAVLLWRALSYSNPVDGTIVGPMLCVMLALVLTMTGVMVVLRGEDFDTGHEQTPARQN